MADTATLPSSGTRVHCLLLVFSLAAGTGDKSVNCRVQWDFIAASPKVLTIVASAAGNTWEDFEERATCSYPSQVVCSNDCSQVQLCMNNGDGLEPSVVETCDVAAGQRCSFSQKTCVSAEASDCHGYVKNFTCNDLGAYPDPYDCTIYHVCLAGDAVAQNGQCEEGYAYNALTSDCSFTTTDRPCVEGPIVGCSTPAQVGVVPENPAIYYVCIREDGNLFPNMRRCHHGQVFDIPTVGCIDKPDDGNSTAFEY